MNELPDLSAHTPSTDVDATRTTNSSGPRQRRVILVAAVVASAIAVLLILTLALGGSDEELQANGSMTSTVSSTEVTGTERTRQVATSVATTTAVRASTTTVVEATTTEPPTTSPSPSSTADSATTLVSETTHAIPVDVVPPPAPPPTAVAPSGNCSYMGVLTIPTIGVEVDIIKEKQQYADGLLCGNHPDDGIGQGVDVLPGFASFEASLNGGSGLVGQIPAVIFGHRTSHNRPFYDIDDLNEGDPVTVSNLDGSTLELQVTSLSLMSLEDATAFLLAPSADGTAQMHLVACARGDGTPGGVSHRWIATVGKS